MVQGISRREFLRAGVGAFGLGLVAACAPQAPSAAPTAKPADAKPAAPAATAAPAAPAKPAEAAKPAETKPAAPAKPAETKPAAPAVDKPGKHLIGKYEGPEILPDARRPAKLGEAPMLAEMVKAGKLPPVEQRIPEEPMVVKPLQEIGKYGGTWRRGFTGPADGENGNRIISTDKLTFWNYNGTEYRPSLAKSWKIEDGGRTFTFSLRKGHKWSDGTPLTADDFMYWYQEIYQNKDLTPTPTAEFSINRKPGTMEKLDETTFQFKFPDPYPGFMDVLGGSTYIGSSQNQGSGPGAGLRGPIAPAHYLKKFHPKFTPQAELDKMAADEKFDNWVNLFKFKADWRLNVDLPVIGPWKTTSPINTPNWLLERNAYYYAVDPEGNQLPYWDKIQFTLAENLEVLNLRAIAGEYDWQERHIGLDKLPVFLENQQKGNYKVYLDPSQNGSDAVIHFNQSYDGDPEVVKWMRNRDFRHAFALGIDRDQLNETFWLGVGTPGSVAPADDSLFSPGPEWRTKWATQDLAQANQLLDKVGLTQKDSEGYRLRTDGKGRLRFELVTVGGSFVPYPRIGEVIVQHLKRIGLQIDMVEQERSLAFRRRDANELQLVMWANDGSELLYAFPVHALPTQPDSMIGPFIGRWYASNGAQGMQPEDPQVAKVLELFRSAAGQDEQQRSNTAKEIWKILIDETYSVGLVGVSPAFMGVRIVKNNIGNVPGRQFNGQHARTPCASHPTTLFFKS